MDGEGLIRALTSYIEAASEERAARKRYEGYEWSYDGFRLVEAKSKAGEVFGEMLNEYIDARIARASYSASAPKGKK